MEKFFFKNTSQIVLMEEITYNNLYIIESNENKIINLFDFSDCKEINLKIVTKEMTNFCLNIYVLAHKFNAKEVKVKLKHEGNNSISNVSFFGASFGNSKIDVTIDSLIKKSSKSEINQSIQGIILSENSVIKGRPILKVEENDSSIKHSLSIGPFNKEKLFYLNLKGLSKIQVHKLIVQSLFYEGIALLTSGQKLKIRKKIKEIINVSQ